MSYTKNIIVFASLSLLGACEFGAGETLYNQSYKLTCPNTVTGTTRIWCITEGKLCAKPASAVACSWNWYTEVGKTEDFDMTNLEEAECLPEWEDGKFPPDPDEENCGADESEISAGSITTPTGGGDGGDPTDGTPTTGDEDDTTGESTGGPEVYLCARNAEVKCADLIPDEILGDDPYVEGDHPFYSELDACWGPVDKNAPPNKILAPCVMATSADDAVIPCEKLCGARAGEIAGLTEGACGEITPDCQIKKNIDCDLNNFVPAGLGQPDHQDAFDYPAKLSDNSGTWDCDGPVQMAAWQGESDLTRFTANGMFTDPDGLYAELSDVSGVIGYTVKNCGLLKCEVTVDVVQGFTKTVNGSFEFPEGDDGNFEIQGVGFQTLGVFTGTWNKLFKIVTFPNTKVDLQFWGGIVSVDGASLPNVKVGTATVKIDHIKGHLGYKGGPLTLDLWHHSDLGDAEVEICAEKPK